MDGMQFQEEFLSEPEEELSHPRHGFYSRKVTITEPQATVFQNGALLFYVDAGRGTLKVNGVDISLSQGAFGWLHSYHLFQLIPEWDGKLELYVCSFDYAAASFIAYQNSLTITREVMVFSSPVLNLKGLERERIKHIMEQYCVLGSSSEPGGMLMEYALFQELSTLYLRYGSRLVEQEEPFKRTRAWMLLQHIFTYSHENMTRQSLAEIYGMTAKEAGRQLIALTGLSFSELLNRARVARACDMLNYEGLSQHYIAFYVGYHSETAFYRAFKEMKHMTPQEYKEQLLVQGRGGQSYLDAAALSVLSYLYRHYRESVTLNQAAAALYMDKTAVNGILKVNFGVDFQTLLTELRTSYARTLLLAGVQPIEEIALSCGYQSSHALIRIFKARFGMTPGEYRRRGGKNADGVHN